MLLKAFAMTTKPGQPLYIGPPAKVRHSPDKQRAVKGVLLFHLGPQTWVRNYKTKLPQIVLLGVF